MQTDPHSQACYQDVYRMKRKYYKEQIYQDLSVVKQYQNAQLFINLNMHCTDVINLLIVLIKRFTMEDITVPMNQQDFTKGRTTRDHKYLLLFVFEGKFMADLMKCTQ